MKQALLALITLTATSAFAGSHCPPGQDNVWGACIDRGAGVLNGALGERSYPSQRTQRAHRTTSRQVVYPSTSTASGPHCPPPQLNVWGACVNPTH